MRLNHDGIKEMLPDYLRGGLSEEMRNEVETHLEGCRDCMGELSFISELIKIEVPDPGEFFWKTLPQKVIGAVNKEKVTRGSGLAIQHKLC